MRSPKSELNWRVAKAPIFDEAFDFYKKERVTFSELGFILKKIHPRYKPCRYGCKTLRAIYEKLDKYEIMQTEEELLVCRKQCDIQSISQG